MRIRLLTIGLLLTTVACVFLIAPIRKAIAQTSANYFTWGSSDDSSILNYDQGGSIELGTGNTDGVGTNPVTGGTPYIDFHYGNGESQDFNYRIWNNGDGVLWFQNSSSNTPLLLEPSAVEINNGVDASGSGLKHARTSSSCATGSTQGNTCTVTLDWPGSPFADTNYTVVCTPEGGQTSNYPASFVYVDPSNKTTTSVGVTVETLNAESAHLYGVDCMAMHD